AELVPSECVTGVDGVLEDEVFDAIGDVLRRRGQPGEDPAVLEVPASLQCSGRFTRWRAGRAEHESCRVPQLVAEAAIALDTALVEADVLARHRDRGCPCAQRVRAVLRKEVARV